MFRLCNERHISMLNIFAYALSKRRLKNMDRRAYTAKLRSNASWFYSQRALRFFRHQHIVQPPVADGFHFAQQDFICRKANFVARTVDLAISILRSCQPFTIGKVPLTFLPLLQIKYALDHEGWAVGVAALWGYYLKRVDRWRLCIANWNRVIEINSHRRTEPFRWIGTRACTINKSHTPFSKQTSLQVSRNDIIRDGNKVFISTPSSVATWHLLPEGEGFMCG